ncbi:MAG: ABC transporter ATP-binding protein, partial [Actinobacteria bacterium]|nr:ABC transporter ATP-binding protein [Actinomycetota bacterium]
MSSLDDHSTLSLVLQVLEKRDKFRLGVALLLILIGTVLEMASLSLVIPVVQAVVGGDQRANYSWLPDVMSDWSYDTFVQLLMGALVAVFLAKNVFLLVSNYFQQRLQLSITNRIYQRLFTSYLRQPYEYHLTYSSAVLVRNVQEYSGAVISSGVAPTISIATESITGLGLLAVLFAVEPTTTAALLAVFVLTSFFIVVFSRSKTRRWGAERVLHRGRVIEALMSGFGGIKEIKLFGRDQEVFDAHRDGLHQASRSSYLFSLAQAVPRALFEVTAVLSVALLVVIATLRDVDLQDATVIIALFGVVAFRMLPSVNKVVQAAQALSFGRAGIEGAATGLAMMTDERPKKTRTRQDRFANLDASSLKYQYPNTDALVIDIDNLTLRAGESLGIVGASGSGKSTLVDLLIGILTPTSGHITVNDRRVDEDPRYWQDRIGYVPQHVYLMDTSIRRNVAFGLPEKVIDATEVERALRLANLWDFVQTLPQGLDTVVGERGVRLSGGQRQRLGIARALYGNPEVIVLDEATSALDEDTEREIVESMREISRDRTLIVVAHRTSTLAHCSRLIRLEAGRIVQEGSFEEVIGSLPNA